MKLYPSGNLVYRWNSWKFLGTTTYSIKGKIRALPLTESCLNKSRRIRSLWRKCHISWKHKGTQTMYSNAWTDLWKMIFFFSINSWAPVSPMVGTNSLSNLKSLPFKNSCKLQHVTCLYEIKYTEKVMYHEIFSGEQQLLCNNLHDPITHWVTDLQYPQHHLTSNSVTMNSTALKHCWHTCKVLFWSNFLHINASLEQRDSLCLLCKPAETLWGGMY